MIIKTLKMSARKRNR
ncbi:TPA: hypothetical protein ACG1J2_000364 [Escherichia coli]|nr:MULTISPECIES: hypothetical protein [Enterobacteriaceae]EHM1043662.1 hypothetical protein [Escherichia coli]EJI6913621.1 hypothetical protein [Escherichia coli]EJS0521538.1 hypothetical protein [Escherichia coli]MCB4493495.1 hypothetical protein [Escherichia coli]MCG0124605.1 hypothetical protein [Escherichia coli]